MLFVAYWELNPDLDPKKIAEVAAKYLQEGKFPVPGVKTVGWYLTAELWGVTVFEVESAETIFKDQILWRKGIPGIFKVFKVSPAMPTENIIPLVLE